MRKIIEIDEDKCNGCEACTKVCAEAALKMVNGKAKLVKDFYCDGMGACLDVCPVDALKIVEKDTEEYDPKRTYEFVKQERGEDAALNIHGIETIKKEKQTTACGCPGTMMKDFSRKEQTTNFTMPTHAMQSALRQWPIQLKLLQPHAPYFTNSDLIVAADCVPFAYPNFHNEFLKNKSIAIFCPKLDSDIEEYIQKLAVIFQTQNIKSITIVKMEVPCCSGVEHIVNKALEISKQNIDVKTSTISIKGELF